RAGPNRAPVRTEGPREVTRTGGGRRPYKVHDSWYLRSCTVAVSDRNACRVRLLPLRDDGAAHAPPGARLPLRATLPPAAPATRGQGGPRGPARPALRGRAAAVGGAGRARRRVRRRRPAPPAARLAARRRAAGQLVRLASGPARAALTAASRG